MASSDNNNALENNNNINNENTEQIPIKKAVAKAARLFNSFRKPDDIPWGDTSYLLEKEDIQKLPKSHLRHHLAARNEHNIKGSARILSHHLKKSLDKEIEEIRKNEVIERKRIQALKDLEMKGAVYSVGSNHRGQLGLGDLKHRTMFTVIPESRGAGFKEVSTRNDIVFAITESHRVYAWGAGGMGPMAIDCKKKRSNFESPQSITNLEEEDITEIAVGLNHACAISKSAVCYSWGGGNSGCLGNGKNNGVQQCPDLIKFPMKSGYREFIQKIDSGEMHCCALSTRGEVYTWGLASNGRLGDVKNSSRTICFPRILNLPVQITMISCGTEHTLAATSSNVYSWGTNDGGRLGLGDLANRNIPCIIDSLQGLRIIDISCGTWHSACIAAAPLMKESGWLYTWGSGYSGQLALKDRTTSMLPALVPFFCSSHIMLTKVFCGSNHNAVFTADREMYTWGSNENGCLGHDIDEAFVSFTSKPGYCIFGAIIDGFPIGRPQSIAIGKGYTIVCTSSYDGPNEAQLLDLDDNDDDSSASGTSIENI